MKKRGCALILCIVLAMAAVGCGKYARDAEKVKFTYSERSIFSTIDNFIQKDLDVYKALPEAKGGYL